jgi:hypothetical protein
MEALCQFVDTGPIKSSDVVGLELGPGLEAHCQRASRADRVPKKRWARALGRLIVGSVSTAEVA